MRPYNRIVKGSASDMIRNAVETPMEQAVFGLVESRDGLLNVASDHTSAVGDGAGHVWDVIWCGIMRVAATETRTSLTGVTETSTMKVVR